MWGWIMSLFGRTPGIGTPSVGVSQFGIVALVVLVLIVVVRLLMMAFARGHSNSGRVGRCLMISSG
jgi:hypothetical protein